MSIVLSAPKSTSAIEAVSKGYEDPTSSTPLSSIVDAFEEIAMFLKIKSSEEELRLDNFCHSCSHISILFGCLGLAFKFAEMEYVAKLDDLLQASNTYDTLHNILDIDVANKTVKSPGSLSRNLRRVRQGLDLIRALFHHFVTNKDDNLKSAASTAYAQVCAPYHTWTVRTAVAAGMYTLPTRDQLLLKLKETNQSAEKKMQRYIRASIPVIEYIDKLYLSRDISLDW